LAVKSKLIEKVWKLNPSKSAEIDTVVGVDEENIFYE
jgi:hypothetical protein